MIWPFITKDTDINQASSTLSPFITTALSGLKGKELQGGSRVRTLAECYVYGAIRYLASYDDIQAADTGILLKSLIISHFDADSNEVKQCLEFCAGVKDGEKEKLFMMEGAGALRRWLVNNDRSAASELKELMAIQS